MTQPGSTTPLPQHVGVVNVGLPLFADAVASQGAPVISVDWRVPAGGQPALVAALGRRGAPEGGPAGHDVTGVQHHGQVTAGQSQRLAGQRGRRGVQQVAVDVDAAQPPRARLPHRVADHPVGGPVVHAAVLHDELGQVGGL